MNIDEIINIADAQKWCKGSTWEFDLYIDHLFVEIMAYGENPIKIDYFQPVLNDEFLNTKLNDNLISKFEGFMTNETAVSELLAKQDKIISSAKDLLSQMKRDVNYLNFDVYETVQKDLSLLMASVSVVFDLLISDYIERISEENNVSLENISAYIIKESGITALNKSNDNLLILYKKYKGVFDNYFIENKPLSKEILTSLNEHAKKYGWINSGEKGRKSWTVDDFLEQLYEIKNLAKENVYVPNNVKKLLESSIKININDNIAADLQIELDFYFQKYLSNKFKNNYDEKVFENLTLKEIKELDLSNQDPNKYLNRTKQAKIIFPYKGRVVVKWLSKDEYKKLSNKISDNSKPIDKKKIKGRPACVGLVEGKAKIVRNQKDLNEFKEGYILVAEKTQPSYVMAMSKAIAIVTDIGGITSHAAIVSRELNIPCVVATQYATNIIKNNSFIRVDGEKGIVEILEDS